MALPNLRRLFVEARTEAEENEYSRNAVRNPPQINSNVIVELSIFLTFMADGLMYLVLQPRIVHIIDCGFQFDGSEDGWWGAEGWEVRPYLGLGLVRDNDDGDFGYEVGEMEALS
jgi:Family of unknown function (DUF5310)